MPLRWLQVKGAPSVRAFLFQSTTSLSLEKLETFATSGSEGLLQALKSSCRVILQDAGF